MKRSILFCALLLAASMTGAAPVLLYETGWEAAPATPPWVPGVIGGPNGVEGQNGWFSFNSPAGHQVVANGSAGAIVNGQAVATPFGNQMHRFTGNTSTADSFLRLAWTDVTFGFNDRPAGYNYLTGSIDIFVPGVQSADGSLYGLVGFDGADAEFGVFVDPSTLSVVLLSDGVFVASVPNAFTLDNWLNLSVTANYETGEIFGSINGTPVPGLSGTANLLVGGFTDLDLSVQNDPGAPVERSIFSDNYRVQVDLVPVPEPSTILLVAGGAAALFWRLRRARR